MQPLSVTTYGKWILAGEHTVLRGGPALVFPVRSKSFHLNYLPAEKGLKLKFSGPYGEDFKLLVWGVLEQALEVSGKKRVDLPGQLEIDSQLPLGAGLGASAALCVAIGRLWQYMGWISEREVYEFSRDLENLFHGESSGVDIAVSVAGQGIRFMRGGEWTDVDMQWQPTWFLSYSGKRGMTSECVKKVKALADRSPELLEKIDNEMSRATDKAELALSLPEHEGLARLAMAIDRARDCFEQWGLIGRELSNHMRLLQENGALAAKPTGSGGGGYVLSLWKKPPANLSDLPFELLPV
ncbi:MAG: hypothetical protein H6626_01275 [Pseudobdellovibrionaceae bacterium]|nr:hypothetical protein [Bdellovibrionales bacterium]USN48920.1 MAG: hypothetical protein H6626_01275 [Pseudobdellovibrionaceae bacterium]